MINSALSISSYKFTQDDRLLLDANIWLYLLPPPSGSASYATRIYSAAFKSMVSAGASLFVSSLILSEYLNRYCRIEWQAIHRQQFADFKKFRQSEKYAEVGANAAAFAKIILRHANKTSDNFNDVDVHEILANFQSGTSDFNDGLIAESCGRHKITLVTHDGDFISGNINVLTENKRILDACAHKRI